MAGKVLAGVLTMAWVASVYAAAAPETPGQQAAGPGHAGDLFQTAGTCMVCHDNLVTPSRSDRTGARR